MENETQTAITIPPSTALTKSVVPPPKKKEIIEAMVRIEHPRLVAEWEALRSGFVAEREALEKIVVDHARKHAKELVVGNVALGSFRTHADKSENLYGVDVRFDDIKLPVDVQKRIVEHHKVKVPYAAPDISTVRNRIAAKMSGFTSPSERVDQLVKDPESRKVLDELLAKIR